MFITTSISKIDISNKMIVAFDTSKKKLNHFTEIHGRLVGNNCQENKTITGVMVNSAAGIIPGLQKLHTLAVQFGYDDIHIVCEPTGVYSNLLMRTAHRLGYSTAYVSGESVAKAKVIENNCNDKNDIKDPRVIFMLSKMGKELQFRVLPPLYQYLRDLNRMYDDAYKTYVQSKCDIHHLIKRIFCDFPMSKDFIYDASGTALMNLYGFNPYRITQDSLECFIQKMRAVVPRIRSSSLNLIYKCAFDSMLHIYHPLEFQILEQRIKYTWDDLSVAQSRMKDIENQLETTYWKLWEMDEEIPKADSKIFTPFIIARLLGETGPMRDFNSISATLKYGGLNLRTRESGFYKGKLKLAKKGRAPIRLITGKMVFGLVRQWCLFGPYYHRRHDVEKVNGLKLFGLLERKIIRTFYALSKRREQFNIDRFTKCESQFRVAA